MHKVATAALAILVLFLLAANSRLEDRRAALERRLAQLERRPRPKPAAVAPIATEPAVSEPAPAVAVAAPAPTAPPPAAAPPAASPDPSPMIKTTYEVTRAILDSGSKMTFWLKSGIPEADLGLTPAQQAAIAELRKRKEELVAALDDRTEASIRDLLTSEQRAKYDSQNRVQEVETAQLEEKINPPPQVAGPKPGYLGVSGTDAAGGGVELQQVFPNTVASLAGLQSGDVIVDIDGEKVSGYAALAEKIRAGGEGKPLSLRVRRAGVEFSLGVQLGPRP